MKKKTKENIFYASLVIIMFLIFGLMYVNHNYWEPSWHTVEGIIVKVEDGSIFHTWTSMWGDVYTTKVTFDNEEIITFYGQPRPSNQLTIGKRYKITYKHYSNSGDGNWEDFPNGYNVVYSRDEVDWS